jgi:UDP-N-acetylglucosamine--N-acetylmuramyl-(pentapeptide) pyrophosphoryl-undecaprenol N-acetylglucosamine transferase
MKRVILVGGGTAGHVEPAIAVGKWLETNGFKIFCEFVGTRHGIEMDLIPRTGWKFHKISKADFPRSFNFSALSWLFRFKLSFWQSVSILRGADLVIGFGGYVSAPVYVAAWIMRVPIIIHEANVKPGWANRLGAKFTKHLTVAFAGTKKQSALFADAKLVGMPIRLEIAQISKLSSAQRIEKRAQILKSLDLNPDKQTVFVFGGSLGATKLNEVIATSLPRVLSKNCNVIHAVGKKNQLPLKITGYTPLSYIENMAEIYLASDLIISRSGAVSCAEIAATGNYALLVPLPVGNGEQEANALDLVSAGQAELCRNSEFSSEWLISELDALLSKAKKFGNFPIDSNLLHADALIGQLALETLAKV